MNEGVNFHLFFAGGTFGFSEDDAIFEAYLANG